MKGVSELDAARLDGLLVGELDWPRLGDTELVRDLYCSSVLRLFFAFRILLKISFNLGGDPIEFLLALRPLARLLQQKKLAGGEPPTTMSHFSRATNRLSQFETKLTCMSAASAGRLTGCATCNQMSFDHLSIQHFLFHFLSGKPDHRGPAVRIH